MAALPAVPNVIKCDYHFAVGGDINAMVREHWQYSGGPPTSANLVSLSATINTSFGTNLKALMNTSNSLIEVFLTDLNSTSGFSGGTVATTAGTRGGSAPASFCAMTQGLIARRYRGGKPRNYWPFLVTADLTTEQRFSGTATTAVNTGVAAHTAAVVGASAGGCTITALVNVSYYQGFTNVPYGSPTKYRRTPTLRAGGPAVDAITSRICSARPGTQRRRYQ